VEQFPLWCPVPKCSTWNNALGPPAQPAPNGLSSRKTPSSRTPHLLTASNVNLTGPFKRTGPSILRVGGNPIDKNAWTTTCNRNTSSQIAPEDVASLADLQRPLDGKASVASTLRLRHWCHDPPRQPPKSHKRINNSGRHSAASRSATNTTCPANQNTNTPETGRSLSSSFVEPTLKRNAENNSKRPYNWTRGSQRRTRVDDPLRPVRLKGDNTLLTQHYYRTNTPQPAPTFSPPAANTLNASGTQLSCHVPALSAVIVQIV